MIANIQSMVWMLGKNTILKAIHNKEIKVHKEIKVWMLGKNTILKAIHNDTVTKPTSYAGVNAG